jgi:hypothetical protein
MTTLTIELPEEETKLFKQFLKKFNGRVVSTKKEPEKEDETAYLSKSSVNKNALDKSIKQAENGQTVKIASTDLWK